MFSHAAQKSNENMDRKSAAFTTDIPKEILEEFQKISTAIYFFGDKKSRQKANSLGIPVGKKQMDHVNKKKIW